MDNFDANFNSILNDQPESVVNSSLWELVKTNIIIILSYPLYIFHKIFYRHWKRCVDCQIAYSCDKKKRKLFNGHGWEDIAKCNIFTPIIATINDGPKHQH